MLSNILAKSNLLSRSYQDEMKRVSVLELHSIYERCPLLNVCFDPSDYRGLSDKQKKQWDARLFWYMKSVTMQDDNRCQVWLQTLAKQQFSKLAECLDEESAFEMLWLTKQVEQFSGSEVEVVKKSLLDFLQGQHYSVEDIEQRLREITGE